MDGSVWISNGMMWVAIAMSPLVLWGSRRQILSRPNGGATFQTLVGINIAVVIVAVILTLFTLGYGQGKARALADNRADERARID